MAEMQDVEVEQGEQGELETVEQQVKQAEEAKPEIPEKYRGKTVEEIVKMHQATEQTLSRQGQELGEVRKLADELLRSQLAKKAEEKPVEVNFFENPEEAVRNAVKNSPEVLEARQYAQQAQRVQVQMKLNQLHPDYAQIIGDVGFAEWIKASKIRTQLFQQADAFDIDAADELLSTYKKLNPPKAVIESNETGAEKKARKQAINAISVDVGGSGEMTKKVYRRADLIRLKMRDPAKYDDLADSGELERAYEEGRVR